MHRHTLFPNGTTFDIYFPAVNEQEEKTAMNGEMAQGAETILLDARPKSP